MQRKSKRVFTVICGLMMVLLLILLLVVNTFFHYYSMVSVSEKEDYTDVIVSLSDEEQRELADIEIELPEDSVFYGEDVLNILLIGTDERTTELNKAARADSIMLVSLNKKTHDVKLISFERDTYVAIPKVPQRNPDKLGHTFQWGGAVLLMETLQTHFCLDVEKYVRVNFAVFEKLVDDLGGVDVALTEVEANIVSRETGTRYHEGQNHLDGAAALHYSRIRKIDSDWMRVKRQQNVIISVKKKLSNQSVGNTKKMMDHCLPYVQTNLSEYECAYLLFHFSEYAKGNVSQKTIPEFKTFSDLEHVNFKSNAKILKEFLYDE